MAESIKTRASAQLVALSMLQPAPWNPRLIKDKRFKSLCESITADPDFLWHRPIIATADGTIYGGNMRYRAVEALGWREVPAIIEDIPAQLAKERALRDNNAWGEWQEDELAELLYELQQSGSNMDLLGFDTNELDRLLASVGVGGAGEDTADLTPPEEPVTKTGDLWLMGDHRLLCGDSTKREDVERVMNGERADTLVSDPPYGVGFSYASHDDSDNQRNLQIVQAAWLFAPSAKVWTCGRGNLARDLAWNGGAKVLIWYMGFASARSGLGGASTWEPVLVTDVHHGTLPNDHLDFPTDRLPELHESHPCPKPLALICHLIEHLAGASVYEPFSGSGTTIVACEQLGRKCYAIEISEQYVDVAIRRWETLTGRKAVLAVSEVAPNG